MTSAASAIGAGPASACAPVGVLIVDDSAVIRGIVARGIEADPDIRVIGSAANGEAALGLLKSHKPQVVILDVEMPVMNGLEALPKILAAQPGVKVIMASALTHKHASITFKALQLGAVDYVPKPDAADGPTALTSFFQELKVKIKAHARPGALSPSPASSVGPAPARFPQAAASQPTAARANMRALKPAAVAIGSSTGGPPALLKVFTRAKGCIRVPVFVTQHMPAVFTALLAEQLGQVSGARAMEGADGVVVEPGMIYVAPGGKHMLVERNDRSVVIRLDDGPQVNFCKPAVDPMLRSLSAVYGSHLLAAILTGMGRDGADGCVAVANSGGHFVVQDEATSVVYGMPAAAAATGRAMAQLPIDGAAEFLASMMQGGS